MFGICNISKKHDLKFLGLGLLLLIIAQSAFVAAPIQRAYAIPPQLATQPVSATKTYSANQLGTQVQTTISFRAELNGTIIFSKDGIESFRMFLPSGLTGATSLLANETHTIVDVRSGSYFIQENWKLNALKFKLEVCWNIPSPATVKLPLSRMDRFRQNIFAIGGLLFDWNDAASAGYSVSYENLTKSIVIPILPSGCVDPLVQSGVNSQPLFKKGVQYFGNAWYVFYKDGTSRVFKCSSAGGAFGVATVFASGDGTADQYQYSSFSNNTHIYLASSVGQSTWDWRVLTPTASCGTTLTSLQTANTAYSGSQVIQNATGWLFYAGNELNDMLVRRSNNLYGGSNSWSDVQRFGGDGANRHVRLVQYNTNKILVYYDGAANSFKAKTCYGSNNTCGGLVTVASSLKTGGTPEYSNIDCVARNTSGNVYCTYVTSAGVLRFVKYNGNSWIGDTQVAYATEMAFGMTIARNNDTMIVYRVSDNLIRWNKTSVGGTSFIDSGSFFIGSQTSPDFMSVSPLPNATGWVGITWKNGSSNIYFTTFLAFPSIVCGADATSRLAIKYDSKPAIAIPNLSKFFITRSEQVANFMQATYSGILYYRK